MSLLAYNLTGSPVMLSGLTTVLPASSSPPSPGSAVNVTGELSGLSGAQYTALEAQRPATVQYVWTGEPQFLTGTLFVADGAETPEFNNVTLIDQGGTRRVIYARLTGNDSTGDGLTVGTAYATIQRALGDVPTYFKGARYVIDCSNMGIVNVTSAAEVITPKMLESEQLRIIFTSPEYASWVTEGDLTIQAVPTLITTLNPGTTNAANATSGQRTYTDVTQAWTVDQQKGRWLVGSAAGQVAVIISNTATDLETTSPTVFTAPLQIVEASTVLTGVPGPGFSGRSMIIQGTRAGVEVRGIKFTSVGGSSQILIRGNSDSATFTMCDIKGISSTGLRDASLSSCVLRGTWSLSAQSADLSNVLADSCTFSVTGADFVSITSYGWISSVLNRVDRDFELSTFGGVVRGTGWTNDTAGLWRIANTEFGAITGVGFTGSGPGRTRMSLCAKAAATGPSSFGTQLTNGHQLEIASGTPISGAAGDLKVGLLSTRTLANFAGTAPIGSQYDVLGDGSRCATTAASASTPVATTSLSGLVIFSQLRVQPSLEQTATGASQTIAHALGVTPQVVLVTITEGHDGAGAAGTQYPTIVQGSHTSTYSEVTITAGAKFTVLAWA